MLNGAIRKGKKDISDKIGIRCVCMTTFGGSNIGNINYKASRYVFVNTVVTGIETISRGVKLIDKLNPINCYKVATWPHTSSISQTFFSKNEMKEYIEKIIESRVKKGALAESRNNILDNEFVFCTGSVDESSIDLIVITKGEVDSSSLEKYYGAAETRELIEKLVNKFY